MKSISLLNLNDRGVTLVELVVVVGVIVILVSALGFEFQDWVARYKIERDIKNFYSKLISLKADATADGRTRFIWLQPALPRNYRIYEDADPWPDGDSILTGADTIISDEECRADILSSAPSQVFGFNRRGVAIFTGGSLIDTSFYIMFKHFKEPDYDCVEVRRTRINLGLFKNGKCETR